jgi:glutamate-5-semialdehyde dehydrogenase
MDNRSKVLVSLSKLLKKNRATILYENSVDLAATGDLDPSLTDRLKVDNSKLSEMSSSLLVTSKKINPDGKLLYMFENSEGLIFKNRSVPFGCILIIYESRPDVTIEAAAMAFKSGNTILLKGGKEARNTNLKLVELWKSALIMNGYTGDEINYLDFTREETRQFISDKNSGIDLIIPRGGDNLIDFVVKNAACPVIVSGRGNNFVYLHEDANPDMGMDIIIDGKSRISVCNAIDKVLINKCLIEKDKTFTIQLLQKLSEKGIQVVGDLTAKGFAPSIQIIDGEEIMYEEFLSSKVLLSFVDTLDQAIDTINKYSGGHSASVITQDEKVAEKFMHQTDCAAVYHNASTRFTDGGQVGFGGEMAISTQKLHFRGPIGMDQLVTNKWMIFGKGHIRN